MSDPKLVKLKSSFEALNTLKNTDEITIDLHFDEIVNNIFDGKRNLLQMLLMPKPEISVQQVDDIKHIFHDALQDQLMQSNSINSKKSEPEPSSLITIARESLILVSSFLDFKSINNLKNTCSSIAPIMIEQFFKMDIQIINIHQFIDKFNNSNTKNNIKIDDVLNSSFSTIRIHKSVKINQFVQNNLRINCDNILGFGDCKYRNLRYTKENFKRIHIDNNTTFNDFERTKNIKFIFMDKNLIFNKWNLSADSILFLQKFDIKNQTLKITDVIVYKSSDLQDDETFISDIRKYIIDKEHVYNQSKSVKLYRLYDDGVELAHDEIFNFFPNAFMRRSKIDTVHKSLAYQIKSNKNEDQLCSELKTYFNEQLEPFYATVEEYYVYTTQKPGLKYNQLGLKLDDEDSLKCFEKAYNLDPNNAVYCLNYVHLLVECYYAEKAKKICIEKLKLYEENKFNIPRDKLLYRYYNTLADAYKNTNEAKLSLEYYHKTIEQLQQTNLPHLDDILYQIYDDITELYQEYYELLGEPEINAGTYYKKMIEIRPNSYRSYQDYAQHLKFQGEFQEALNYYMKALQIVQTNELQSNKRLIPRIYDGCICCLTNLSNDENTEQMCVKAINFIHENCPHYFYLSRAYNTLFNIYQKDTKYYEKAKSFYLIRLSKYKGKKASWSYIQHQMEYAIFLEMFDKISECVKQFNDVFNAINSQILSKISGNVIQCIVEFLEILNKHQMNEQMKEFSNKIITKFSVEKFDNSHTLFHSISLFYLKTNRMDTFDTYKNHCFQLVTENKGKYFNYCFEYAQYFQKNKQLNESLNYFEKVISKVNYSPDRSESAEYYIKYIQLLFEMNKFKKTETLLLSLLRKYPNDYKVNHQMALFYLKQNQHEKANIHCTNTLKLIIQRHEWKQTVYEYIQCLISNQQFEKTIPYYKKLLNKSNIEKDYDPECHLKYTKILIKLGQYNEAESMYNYLTQIIQYSVDVNSDIALFYQNILKDYGKSQSYYLKCIEIDPTRNRDNYSFLLYTMQKYAESLKEIQIAMKHSAKRIHGAKQNIHKIHFYHAMILTKLNKYNEAKKEYEFSIKSHKSVDTNDGFWNIPTVSMHEFPIDKYHYEYGMFLLNYMNDKQNAIEQFQKAYKIDPNNSQYKNAAANEYF